MRDPLQLEDRAAELYQCAQCCADLDHPGAECPACPLPLEAYRDPELNLATATRLDSLERLGQLVGMDSRDGVAYSPDLSEADRTSLAAALEADAATPWWLAAWGVVSRPRQLMRTLWTAGRAVLGLALGSAMFSLFTVGLFLDAHQVDAQIIAWKAEAWTGLLGVAP